MEAVDSEIAMAALKKAQAASADLAKEQTPAPKPEKKDDAADNAPDLSKLLFADATEQAPN